MNRKRKKLRLDIACGKNKKRGFVGVDIWDGADIVTDLERFPWPFEDSSIDEIFCSHYIEHTPNLVSFANELYRIMKTGAKAEIIAPYYSSIRAWQDPTHLRAISEATFLYFSKDWRKANRLDHYPLTVDFDCSYGYFIDPYWRGKNKEDLEFAVRHYINVVSDIHVVLIKRQPENDAALSLVEHAAKCWEKGQHRKANALCLECLAIEPNIQAYLITGEYNLKHGNFAEALHSFMQAISIDAESLEANTGLVRAYVGLGQISNARRHKSKLSSKYPDVASLLAIDL